MSDQDIQQLVHRSEMGLTEAEAAEGTKRGEVNHTKPFSTRTLSGILQNNILSVFNGILVVSIVALIIIRQYSDGVFLLMVTFFNVMTGIIGELRAKLALDKLALLQRRVVTVVRGGRKQEISVEAIVKDDTVLFGSGDQIIADGILSSFQPVSIDESILTGESDTVIKHTGDELLSGSFCVSGSGRMIATRVGEGANLNILANQARAYKFTRTPLQQNINRIIQMLTVVMVLFIFLLVLAGFIRNMPVAAGILAIVTVIKALVPEGLVLVSTLAFALGALRVARGQVLVQKLNSIESMSHLTILCLDKTGTLGTNRLLLEEVVPLGASSVEEVSHALGLLVGAVEDKNKTICAIETKFPGISTERIDELPFSSAAKVSAVQVRENGTEVSLWLGAPEVLGEKSLSPGQKKRLTAARRQGLRALLFAQSSQSLSEKSIPEQNTLSLLGLVFLRDELRADVNTAIQFFESRGVRMKILSGDHPETVAVLAAQAGISVSGQVLSGSDLQDRSPAEMSEAVKKGQIFGRLSPQQKRDIVQYLQISGEYVGMIGDGVNDVLALKQADIGVAMHSGAAAARDVADIVLLQDSFAHLPLLSQEGDRIISNIKRAAQLFFTKNIYSILFILFAGFIGLEFPLTPRYITWIDFLTIGIPAALLTLMTPVVKQQSVKNFLPATLRPAALYGTVIAFLSLAVYAVFFLFEDRTRAYGKTAAVSTIILLGLYVVHHVSIAEQEEAVSQHRKVTVWAILVGALALNFLAIYWPPLTSILKMTPLDVDSWATIFLVSGFGMWIISRIVTREFMKNSII